MRIALHPTDAECQHVQSHHNSHQEPKSTLRDGEAGGLRALQFSCAKVYCMHVSGGHPLPQATWVRTRPMSLLRLPNQDKTTQDICNGESNIAVRVLTLIL